MNNTTIAALNFIEEQYGALMARTAARCLAGTTYADPVAWSAELSGLCRLANSCLELNPQWVIDDHFRDKKGYLYWPPTRIRDDAREWLKGRRHD